VLGTPAFMAPEQARGEDVDQRADVYALGAMLELLLVGLLPRKAADAALALAPPALVAVCKRALAPERGDRHAHAGDFARDLRAALAQPAAPPPAPSPWRRILGQS
jgi:serine/threonine-protein kinase